MKPYILAAPDYDKTSGGNKVFHLLCHYLNQLGATAYVTAKVTNPQFNTPTISDEKIREIGPEAIVIYPDIISGNPMRSNHVVRYMMNAPGFYEGYRKPDKEDTIVWFTKALKGTQEGSVLYIPSADRDIFNDKKIENREGVVYYIGKAFQEGVVPPKGIEITRTYPSTQTEIADLFRKSEVFYSYVNSGLIEEARLCGCPVVFMPNKYAPYVYLSHEGGFHGLSIGEEGLKRAKETVHLFQEEYDRAVENIPLQISRFIEETQKPKKVQTKRKIVSIDLHDFSILRNRLDLLLQLKDHYPNLKVSCFTIPYDYQFEMNPQFRIYRATELEKVKENLSWIQIIPHGLTHIPREFENCDRETAEIVFKNIHEVFTKDGLPFEKGFCAPFWLWSQDVVDTLDSYGWWGAVDRNQPEMRRTKRTYTYTHSISDPFWTSSDEVLNLHGHIDGVSENDIERSFLNLFHLPQNTEFRFVTDFIV